MLYVHIHKIYMEKCKEKCGKLLTQREGILDTKEQKWNGNSLFSEYSLLPINGLHICHSYHNLLEGRAH